MKFCNKCGLTKPLDEFSKDKNKSKGVQSQCKQCLNDKAHSAYVENLHDRRARQLARNVAQRELARQYLDTLKERGCFVCGEATICCMDFHHIDKKAFEISDALSRGFNVSKIKSEIVKCIMRV